MDISWDDARLFLAIAETGSFSGGIGQPTVSRRLAALEYAVGASLFRRGVDGAVLTAAGERLVSPAKKMAEWAESCTARRSRRTRRLGAWCG
ncbi:helix-turn-helix domain-containing protein [Myxococcus xanthus]|uniref:helix-turn-helix domain-containing protein n=1 Tax=Myxococcus xanthus TaxID=34 RepID=UPI001F333537|nr:LysR family transcriptional regulator [Myxococcus xanthus]